MDRQLFVALGLYAPMYSPAWYDDTDAAFAIRKAGYTVYFTPFAEVGAHSISRPNPPISLKYYSLGLVYAQCAWLRAHQWIIPQSHATALFAICSTIMTVSTLCALASFVCLHVIRWSSPKLQTWS